MLTVLAWIVLVVATIWNIIIAAGILILWLQGKLKGHRLNSKDVYQLGISFLLFVLPAVYLFGVW